MLPYRGVGFTGLKFHIDWAFDAFNLLYKKRPAPLAAANSDEQSLQLSEPFLLLQPWAKAPHARLLNLEQVRASRKTRSLTTHQYTSMENHAICANYHRIIHLNIANKILSSLMCERPGKPTIDQIFTMRQVRKSSLKRRKNSNAHRLFVDFKSAVESTKRSCLYVLRPVFGIPGNLLRLCKLMLGNTLGSVKRTSRDFFYQILERKIRAK